MSASTLVLLFKMPPKKRPRLHFSKKINIKSSIFSVSQESNNDACKLKLMPISSSIDTGNKFSCNIQCVGSKLIDN